jgi:hypothetical protein
MNSQSHHFILFNYADSSSARDPNAGTPAPDVNNMAQITPSLLGVLGTSSFDGNKNITAAWQEDADLNLPEGTGLMWPQRTYLDMNFHVKNYNATSVLPCDFYFNLYFRPRSSSTIPMISNLVNNPNLGKFQLSCIQIPPNSLPYNQLYTENYNDHDNGAGETRYLWMAAGHTHKLGKAYYIIVRDTTGALADTIYDGQYDYTNQSPLGYWDHSHPPLEYWPNLYPVVFGANNSGLVANTTWLDTVPNQCIHFGFTTSDEMQLFYYMYTLQMPTATGIKDVSQKLVLFDVVPNPMNGNGKLLYNLDKDARVEASIYDITGKVLASMDAENQQLGTHEISIATNQKLAPGIYFARLLVDGVAHTKKFVVTE